MFNRNVMIARGDSSHETTIIQQQPHDAADAARLYGELESKAEAKVHGVVHRQLDSIKAEYAEVHAVRSVMDMHDEFKVLFKINDRPITASIIIKENERLDRAFEPLRKIAEGITEAVLQKLAPDLMRNRIL
jgi:hypothetical protein